MNSTQKTLHKTKERKKSIDNSLNKRYYLPSIAAASKPYQSPDRHLASQKLKEDQMTSIECYVSEKLEREKSVDDILELKLQVQRLMHQGKQYLRNLDSIIKQQGQVQSRHVQLKQKEFARAFRQMQDRIALQVDENNDISSEQKRREMQQFLEAAKKNLIFLQVKN
jgi:hypothetical protein